MDRITRNDTKHGSHAKQPTEPLHDDTVIDETPAPSDTTPFLGASSRERQATSKRRKPNFITKGVNRWCNRLLGAVSERTLADQEEEYAAHRPRLALNAERQAFRPLPRPTAASCW